MDLIDRNLIGELVDSHGNVHYEDIAALPSAQPERKKGKWILVNGRTSINCSACWHCNWSREFEQTVRQFNFCPNCGSDNRGDSDGSD